MPGLPGLPNLPGFPGPRGQDTTRRDTTRRPGVRDTTRRDTTRRDSTGYVRSLITDTTWVVDKDSTARLKEFTYQRHDSVQVQLFPDRTHPLFGTVRSSLFRRDLALDSLGTTLTARETVGGVDIHEPVSIPLSRYIAERRKFELRKLFADEARRPKALVARNDLGELLSSITKIQIPLPPNPIFSIFGKNVINLNISGAVDIKAGFRSTKSDQTTISSLDQTRNEPDFSQEVQVNVNGMIGDKLNIMADWNTQRQFEYENQLKIKYTGYDDEIVQSVEAGNVSLSTPSSFIGSSQALFGIKAKFQLGPLTLTTLASQKKGQIKEVDVSGGAKEQTFEMRAFEYATNHYFVDTTNYKRYYESYYQTEPPTVTGDMQQTQIVEEEVWVQRQGGIPDPNERQGIAFITLPQRGIGYDSTRRYAADIPGSIETAPFIRLDRTQYEMDGDGYLGVLSLNVNVGDQQVVGLAYRTAQQGVQVGEFARDFPDTTAGKKLILKMVKPRNLLSNGRSYPLAWELLLKNIYPITGIGRNLKKEGFSLDIFRQVPGAEDQNVVLNVPLLQLLGLDKYTGDEATSQSPDGKFDFRPARTISQARAEIIFPWLRPFDTGILKSLAAKGTALTDTSYLYKEVYDTTTTFAQQSLRNRYVIRGKATGEASSRYSLGFNVVEGSVQVLLNGTAMVNNVDYTVDYILGEVVIKSDRALVPGANLQIKFEQNDLFQLASKTLLGARGDLALGQNTNFGFTIMNLNQQTLSDKVRLGEEPSNNTIMGVDGATQFNLPILTRALDALPLLQTHEPSQLKVSGEAAYMIPNANTSTSTIASDNGEAIAYIDDFEGARRTIPIGIEFSAWTQASPLAGNYFFPGLQDTAEMNSKAKLIWFNRLPTNVKLTDLYPQKAVGTNPANNQATVLDLQYFPKVRGQFNYSIDLEHTLTPRQNWNGIMKTLSVSAINLLKENVNFIELWMKIDKAPLDGSGKMIIDMGAVSERALPNGPNARGSAPNSEDLVLGSYPNGTLNPGEDVGLDMRSDDQERIDHADLIAARRTVEPNLASDPSGDDYYFNSQYNYTASEDFSHINGTEGNGTIQGGNIPNTEDLNGNGQCDQTNAYFEYEIPLDTTVARNPFVTGGGNPIPGQENGPRWYQFRIPIRDTARTVGTPTAENIEYIRVAFVNATDTILVRVADFNLVGNQWQKVQRTLNDSSFDVGVVNIEENWPAYQSPPGVIRERDKTQPDQNVQANEQSLAFFLTGLADGRQAEAARFFTFKALDLFNYKTMKMFVHGDDKLKYVDPSNYDAEIYYRFGLDSLNYYEYRAPIRPGWDPLNDVVITLADVTALKQTRDSVNLPSKPQPVTGGPPGATYRVLGNPSLTQVVYLAIGVQNPVGKGSSAPIFGQVWVNELRLISVDNSRGWAYRMDTQLKLADLGAVAFNYQRVDPNFHTLEQRFGSRQLSTSWGLSASMELSKFLPSEWAGTTIPVSFSRTVSTVQPKYLPNSDVLVTKAAELQREKILNSGGTDQEAAAEANTIIYNSESKRTTDTWAAPSLRIALPSGSWAVRDILNKLTFGFSYTHSSERSPSVVFRTSWSWNARISYSVSLSPDYYFQPFQKLFGGLWFLDEYKDLKIFYAPSNLNWAVTASRSRDNSLQRSEGATLITSRNFTASRQLGFSWKGTEGGLLNLAGDYSLGVESTLLNMELDRDGQQRSFSKIISDIFFHDKLVNFGQDTRFQETNNFTTKPNIPNIFGIKKYVDLQFGYSVSYAWQDALTSGDLGKSAGFNNTINFTMGIRLKQLFDPLFEEDKTQPSGPPPETGQVSSGRRSRETEAGPDTSAVRADSTGGRKGPAKIWQQLKTLMKVFIKIPVLDYDNISINFNQTNSAQNSGIVGRTGFVNFWGRVPFFQSSLPANGPSFLYQLGLISDPSGRLTNFRFVPKPPFMAWDVEPGIRAANGVLVNTYRETNRLTLKTSRALWEGARLDLNWNVGWSYSRSENIQTDSLGRPTVVNATTSGNVDRSFISMPDVLFLGLFKTSLKEVAKRYGELKSSTDSSSSDDEKLSQAFEQGFEAMPFFRKIFGQFYPRVNWSMRWDGLEKLPMFASFVSRLSLDHAYTSNYTRQFQNRPGGGGERTDGQRVAYGFAPLIGLNFTFKELAKGSFGATLRYNTNTSYDLTTSSRNIVEALTQEISVSANYTRKGFEIPFFGLSLSNDIDISAAYSVSKNSRTTYDVSKLEEDLTGTPLEGSTRTTMEPRIKYVLSSRVSAAVYYRYTKIQPDASGSRIPGTTTNEAGLDVHIAIQ